MELIVLGTSAAYPAAGKACSGYLINEGETHILLDIGTGVLSNLFRWLNPSRLSGIVVTHLHPDHFLDIYPLRLFLQVDGDLPLPLRILAPPGAEKFITQLVVGNDSRKFLEFFKFENIENETNLLLGQVNLQFYPVTHLIPTFGVIVGDEKLAYSSDCAYDPTLLDLARGKEAFLCEATLQKKISPGHLTARQAGEIAQKAGVKRLFLTHIWPTYDPEISKKEAEEVFEGKVIVATENQRYQL